MKPALILQKRKNKKYIQFIEDVLKDCYIAQKAEITFIYDRKTHTIECEIIDVDKTNHMIVCERNDTIIFIPTRKILKIR